MSEPIDTAPHPDRRARLVSGAAFGLAAALASVLVIGMSVWVAGDASMSWPTLLSPFIWAAPAAFVGGLAGPRLAAMPTAGGGGFVGAGVTVAAAFLLLVGLYLGTALVTRDAAVIAELRVPLVWWVTLAGALVFAPVGALAGWIAWRRIHRGTTL